MSWKSRSVWKVLGTHLSLLDVTQAELDHRIAVAWRKFWALKALLLNSRVSRKRRLQLFESSISNSFLYGAHAWTPRTEELKKNPFRSEQTVAQDL